MRGEMRLLIEPVWNRNVSLSSVAIKPSLLLIEPVWNRNFRHSQSRQVVHNAFNRTSLE